MKFYRFNTIATKGRDALRFCQGPTLFASRFLYALFALVAIGLSALSISAQANELAQQLKSPDYVLLMRHAYAPGVGDPPGYSLKRCETQRVLNEEGKAQAVRAGQWLRANGVEKARVYSSIWCRCQQTAQSLQLGPVIIEPSLASFFDRPTQASAQNQALQQFIAKLLKTKGDHALILVTHHVNIREFMGRDIGSGDMVLARVSDKGQVLDYKLYPSP